jgi:PPOX class probable F420-dependent enzyme
MTSLLNRVAALQNRFLDRLRHPAAFEVARSPGIAGDFSAFRGARQCLLVTFKRSGEPVPSPVNFGLSSEETLYFRCEAGVAKVKRLKRNPHVRVCPCTFRGKPTGPLIEGAARVLPDPESQRAHDVIAANWDLASRVFERTVDRLGVPLVYIEVTPAPRKS